MSHRSVTDPTPGPVNRFSCVGNRDQSGSVRPVTTVKEKLNKKKPWFRCLYPPWSLPCPGRTVYRCKKSCDEKQKSEEARAVPVTRARAGGSRSTRAAAAAGAHACFLGFQPKHRAARTDTEGAKGRRARGASRHRQGRRSNHRRGSAVLRALFLLDLPAAPRRASATRNAPHPMHAHAATGPDTGVV